MQEHAGKPVFIDWKAVGRDYLGFFPEHYPALAFLRGAGYEALQDAMANESTDTCFEALSGFLARHDHQLWSLDTGGDDHLLYIVHQDDVTAFVAEHTAQATGDFEPQCERLAPDAPPWAAPEKPAARKRKTLPELVEDTDWHADYGGIHGSYGGDIRYRIIRFEDDDGTFDLLVDLSRFPSVKVDAEGWLDLIEQGHECFPVHATAAGQVWEWSRPGKGQHDQAKRVVQWVLVSDYQAPVMAEIEGASWRSVDSCGVVGNGDTLCVAVAIHPDAAWMNSAAPVIGGSLPGEEDENRPVALLRLQDMRMTHVATIAHGLGLQLLLLGPNRLLVLRNASSSAETQEEQPPPAFFLLDLDAGTVIRQGSLVHGQHFVGANYHAPDESGFLYVRVDSQAHPTNPHLSEKTGWLVQVDPLGARWREARLEGLHNDFTVNMALLRGQVPDRHRVRSFEGGISFAAGHGSVLILNHLTSYSGKYDLAWLWDRDTDAVTIIRQTDFPRRTPSLHYLPAESRYVADESCRVDLLIPYEQIQDTRPQMSLAWTPWQTLACT